MKLFSYWRSTCSWRVRIALAYKGIAYHYMPVDLRRDGGEQNTQEYQALNPMQQVPLLEFDNNGVTYRLSQSIAILEFLEERYPSPSLLPTDLYLRSVARQLAEIINSGVQPFQNVGVLRRIKHEYQADEKAFAQHFILRGLHAFDAQATKVAGRFCVGDTVTFADVCLVPQLNAARRYDVDVQPFSTLRRIEAECTALPAFQAAHCDQQTDAPRT